MHAMKKITLLTYKHLKNSSRGRRILAMGKMVSEKMILPDLQKRQNSLHVTKSRRALFDFCKVPGAQQPALELIMVMQTTSRRDS